MPVTTAAVLPAPVAVTFAYKLLSVPTPNFIYKIAAVQKKLPRNGGDTLRFRRYNPLAAAPVPLGMNGQDPAAQLLTAVDIDAKLSRYGSFVMINEQVN